MNLRPQHPFGNARTRHGCRAARVPLRVRDGHLQRTRRTTATAIIGVVRALSAGTPVKADFIRRPGRRAASTLFARGARHDFDEASRFA
jgi:hypothetical protein